MTHDHACNQSKLSCANWFWNHKEKIYFPPTFLNSVKCWMQICFQNLPSDRAPAGQPRGTGSSLAVKICQKPRATFPWQQWAWPGPTQILSKQQHHTHLPTGYSWFICPRQSCRPQHGTQLWCTAGTSVPASLWFGFLQDTANPRQADLDAQCKKKKGRPLPSLQSTLQLEGCLKNSILPQFLPKTTSVKRIYISKLSPSLIFILFLHVLI